MEEMFWVLLLFTVPVILFFLPIAILLGVNRNRREQEDAIKRLAGQVRQVQEGLGKQRLLVEQILERLPMERAPTPSQEPLDQKEPVTATMPMPAEPAQEPIQPAVDLAGMLQAAASAERQPDELPVLAADDRTEPFKPTRPAVRARPPGRTCRARAASEPHE